MIDRDGEIEELILKVQLLADDAQKVESFQAKIIAWDVKFTATSADVSRLLDMLEGMTRDHASLRSKIGALHTAGTCL